MTKMILTMIMMTIMTIHNDDSDSAIAIIANTDGHAAWEN